MALSRNVMMPDGAVRGWHVIDNILHIADQETRDEVVSTVSENDASEPYRTSVVVEMDDTLTFGKAYENLANDERFIEYTDPAQAALDEVLPILTDEQAEQVIDAFPSWQVGKAYKVGDRVRYSGNLYKCVQAHTSQADWAPDVSTSLWSRVGEGDIPEWVQPTGAHDAYALGDKVRHDGKVWVSAIDANTYEPGVYGWDEV